MSLNNVLCFMLCHYFCNFRHNTDLFDFFVYVLYKSWRNDVREKQSFAPTFYIFRFEFSLVCVPDPSIIWVCESPAIILYSGVLITWKNVEINYLNLSLTGILKLHFVACFLLREKFETMPSLPKTSQKLNTA